MVLLSGVTHPLLVISRNYKQFKTLHVVWSQIPGNLIILYLLFARLVGCPSRNISNIGILLCPISVWMDLLRHICVCYSTNVHNSMIGVVQQTCTTPWKSWHIPLCNTVSGQRSFRFRTVKLWNNLDNELKQLPFGTFKKKIETNMIDHYFNWYNFSLDYKMIHFKLLLLC